MKRLTTICAVALFFAVGANAALITSAGDAALAGATVIDFESQATGTYTSLAIGDVTFTANNNHLRINSDSGLDRPPYVTGGHLDNGVYGNEGFSSLTIDFAVEATAFGYGWAMAEDFANWSLVAYDASNNVLDTYVPLPTWPGNGFVGIAAAGIDHAVVSSTAAYDWISIDDFTYNVVPVPGAVLLGMIGLSVVGVKLRKSA